MTVSVFPFFSYLQRFFFIPILSWLSCFCMEKLEANGLMDQQTNTVGAPCVSSTEPIYSTCSSYSWARLCSIPCVHCPVWRRPLSSCTRVSVLSCPREHCLLSCLVLSFVSSVFSPNGSFLSLYKMLLFLPQNIKILHWTLLPLSATIWFVFSRLQYCFFKELSTLTPILSLPLSCKSTLVRFQPHDSDLMLEIIQFKICT